jgi:nucleotide-binding universal stress UspA family protein
MAGSPLVVGVDMSDEAQRALTAGLQLARRLGCGVVVVHAVGLLEEGGYRPTPPLDELLDAARAASPTAVSDVPVEVLREDGPAADGWCALLTGRTPRCWSSGVAGPVAPLVRWAR